MQFMKFANMKKLRITDLFRKMDTDNDTFLDKDEFIDGITKTSTSPRSLTHSLTHSLTLRHP